MLAFTFITSLIFYLNVVVHDFHTSLAQVYYNKNSQAFEVTLRVFTDDLEVALTLENGNKKINLEDVQQADSAIAQYLSKHFAIINKQNQKKEIVYVGKEIAVDVTWLYVEIPMKEEIDGMKIQNSLLTEIFDDQVNIVNLKYLSAERTFLFKANQTTQKTDIK